MFHLRIQDVSNLYPIGFMYGMFTNICHILPLKTTIHVGKYTSPMDGMGTYTGVIIDPLILSTSRTSQYHVGCASWRQGFLVRRVRFFSKDFRSVKNGRVFLEIFLKALEPV